MPKGHPGTHDPPSVSAACKIRRLRAEGYEFLGITPEAVNAEPRIEPLLRKAKVDPWEYLAGSSEPEARKVLQARASLTKNRAITLPFEAFCVAAGVTTKRMWGILCGETFEQTRQAAAMYAASKYPEVMEATVEAALRPAGTQEKRMLHQHTEFLPMPKTQIVNVRAGNAVIGGNQTNVAVLPPVEDTVKRMSDRFLELAPPAVEVVAEREESEDDE